MDSLPVFSLEAAYGNFGTDMAVEPQGWLKCHPHFKFPYLRTALWFNHVLSVLIMN